MGAARLTARRSLVLEATGTHPFRKRRPPTPGGRLGGVGHVPGGRRPPKPEWRGRWGKHVPQPTIRIQKSVGSNDEMERKDPRSTGSHGKSRSQDPRSPGSLGKNRIQDLQNPAAVTTYHYPGSPGCHGEAKFRNEDPQDPRSPGSQDRTKSKDPRSAGSHNKTNVQGVISTGSRNKMLRVMIHRVWQQKL